MLLVGGALMISGGGQGETYQPPVSSNRQITMAELREANGREGRECLVAVDGIVYKIEDSAYWQDGQHSTSEGQAYCGADLSEAIKRSPHGKSKLQQLEVAGKLIN